MERSSSLKDRFTRSKLRGGSDQGARAVSDSFDQDPGDGSEVSLVIAEKILKAVVESLTRAIELVPGRINEYSLEMFDILIMSYGQSYLAIELENLYYNGILVQQQKLASFFGSSEINLKFVEQIGLVSTQPHVQLVSAGRRARSQHHRGRAARADRAQHEKHPQRPGHGRFPAGDAADDRQNRNLRQDAPLPRQSVPRAVRPSGLQPDAENGHHPPHPREPAHAAHRPLHAVPRQLKRLSRAHPGRHPLHLRFRRLRRPGRHEAAVQHPPRAHKPVFVPARAAQRPVQRGPADLPQEVRAETVHLAAVGLRPEISTGCVAAA
ncbi:hypothetical protein KL939_000757 [Ogataea angusta]|nr:hypothetical protein KL939_000757 [Ogataea angusta]